MSKVINEQNKGFDHYRIANGMFIPQQTFPSGKKLRPGIYQIFKDPQSGQIFFTSMSTMTDGLIDLPSHISDRVIKDVNKFWTPETRAKFDKYNMVYKRGVLLYGPPGSGKTVITTKIMEQVVNEGGLVFFDVNPQLLYEGVSLIKEIQGDIKILSVYEEFDAWINEDSKFLSLLDGELQIENVVYLATTNYIDRIPPRIKNRPSRFACVVEVGLPAADVRKAFLLGKLGKNGLPESELNEWVAKSEGFTLDHLKDLIISVLCIGVSLDETIEKLKTMNATDLDDGADVAWDSIDELMCDTEAANTPVSMTHAMLKEHMNRIGRKIRR